MEPKFQIQHRPKNALRIVNLAAELRRLQKELDRHYAAKRWIKKRTNQKKLTT